MDVQDVARELEENIQDIREDLETLRLQVVGLGGLLSPLQLRSLLRTCEWVDQHVQDMSATVLFLNLKKLMDQPTEDETE